MTAQSLQKIALVSLLLGSLVGVRAEEASTIRVECSLNGEHGDDPNRVPFHEEVSLIQWAVKVTLPYLEPELRRTDLKLTYFANHDPGLQVYLGWGPEDDSSYREGDRTYYPEGTIRDNFTEKFLVAIKLGRMLAESDPQLLEGVTAFAAAFVKHEVLHALQYETAPVRDIAKHPELIIGGLVDRSLLKEHRLKIEYEKDAYRVHREIFSAHAAAILRLADAIEAYAKVNPGLFAPGGAFALAAPDAKYKPLVGEYMREGVATAGLGREFGPTARLSYYSQVVPAELTWELLDANEGAGEKWPEEIARIYDRWAELMLSPGIETRRKNFPYLVPIEARFNAELRTYHASTPPEEFVYALAMVAGKQKAEEQTRLLMRLLDSRESPLALGDLMSIAEIVHRYDRYEDLKTIQRMMAQASEIPELFPKDLESFIRRINYLPIENGGRFSRGIVVSTIRALETGIKRDHLPASPRHMVELVAKTIKEGPWAGSDQVARADSNLFLTYSEMTPEGMESFLEGLPGGVSPKFSREERSAGPEETKGSTRGSSRERPKETKGPRKAGSAH